MATVVGFDPHDLILVTHVQRKHVVRSDRDVEDSRTNIRQVVQSCVVIVFLSDEFGTAKPVLRLRGITARNEDRGIVDGDRHRLFGGVRQTPQRQPWEQVFVPERRRIQRVSQESGVLLKIDILQL
jgi:hypothetical protein